MKNQPNRIFLNTGIEGSDKGVDFQKLAFVTWADRNVCGNDLEYLSKAHLKRVLLARLNKYRSQLSDLTRGKLGRTSSPQRQSAIHEKTALIQELKYLIDKLDV